MLGYFFTEVLKHPLMLFASIVVARILGPEDRGRYAFAITLYGLGFLLGSIGIISGVRYYVVNRQYDTRDVLFVSTVAVIINTMLPIAALWVAWRNQWLGVTGNTFDAEIILIVSLMILFMTVNNLFTRFLVSADLHGWLNVYVLTHTVLANSLLLVVVPQADLKLMAALWVLAANEILFFLVTFTLIVRTFGMRMNWDGRFIVKAYKYGLRGYAGKLAQFSNVQMDRLFLGTYLDPSFLGIYSIAVRMGEFILMLPRSIGNVLFNRTAQASSEQERIRLIGLIHRTQFLLLAVFAAIMGLAARPMILLMYGPDYAGAYEPLLFYLPGAVGVVTAQTLTRYFGATGRPEYESGAKILGALVGVGAYIVLIPRFQAEGAAMSSSIVYLSMSLSIYLFFRRVTRGMKTNLFSFRTDDFRWIMRNLKTGFGQIGARIRRRIRK